jgi:hypothetical protein
MYTFEFWILQYLVLSPIILTIISQPKSKK